MDKFTNINNNISSPENPKNVHDAVVGAINELLTIDIKGENTDVSIQGKDEFAKLMEKLVEIQNIKTTINVLEQVKANSFRNLNLEWINEAIEFEKKKL